MEKGICKICSERRFGVRYMGNFYCEKCVGEIQDFMNEIDGKVPAEKKDFAEIRLTPRLIKEKLDEYVVGQEKAKKILCVAASNHYARLSQPSDDGVEIEKSNILMIGPTGCGKTHLIKSLAKIIDVPLVTTSATTLTEAGYIGEDVESVVERLYSLSGKNIEKAEKGIIFIDEIDKLVSSDGAERRVGGKGVQQALLTMLEGTKVKVGKKGIGASIMETRKDEYVDTKNILFICGGAFSGIENIISKRLGRGSNPLGFAAVSSDNKEERNLLLSTCKNDLLEFGMVPEFLGRLPILASLEEMTTDFLMKILVEPKNAILKQYTKLFKMHGIDLIMTKDALFEVAKAASLDGSGARALRGVLEDVLLDLMYELPSDETIESVEINGEYVRTKGKSGPKVKCRGAYSDECDSIIKLLNFNPDETPFAI